MTKAVDRMSAEDLFSEFCYKCTDEGEWERKDEMDDEDSESMEASDPSNDKS